LTASANPAPYGVVVLTATVIGSGLTPTGTVIFYNGTAPVASQAAEKVG
jgi:multisubunit Na+/H+ antiporter MnhC subunit